MAKIRIVIADDHAILRAGLELLLNAQPDLEVVGHAETIHEIVPACLAVDADVLLQDLSMPGGSGVSAIAHVRQECPRTRILVLTVHDDPVYMRAAMTAGAMGYIVKTAGVVELMTAIRAVHQGRVFVDLHVEPHLFAASPSALLEASQTPPPASREGSQSLPLGSRPALSRREREVLILLAEGYTNQQIADRLFLSVKTIDTYRARIAEKLDLRSRADIVRYAMEVGLFKTSHSNVPDAPA
ncbi:MAG TPA: response regulator transcription factor [Gemmataceae bacterium]|jgi:DNA-binding NarL/FixJ family response regulator